MTAFTIRGIDILCSTFALLVLLPILLTVCLVLRFSGEREIFYVQKRNGRGNTEFGVIKFATMLKNSPNIGAGTLTVKNDPRILPFGHFLRATKINELPQLLNVIRGEMSLIGPRPLTRQTLPPLGVEELEKIYSVPPGLSGVASIFFRDEENMLPEGKEAVSVYHKYVAPYKASLDMWYAENRSVYVYLLGIALTVIVVVRPQSSSLLFRVFPTLPRPSSELSDLLTGM